jgi:hypothetical protein
MLAGLGIRTRNKNRLHCRVLSSLLAQKIEIELAQNL